MDIGRGNEGECDRFPAITWDWTRRFRPHSGMVQGGMAAAAYSGPRVHRGQPETVIS